MRKTSTFFLVVCGISALSGIALLSVAHAAVPTCNFTRPLYQGISGPDVSCLQGYLDSFDPAFDLPMTGYFGGATQGAVIAWQKANGVSPASGYFGLISQAKYTALARIGDSGSGNVSILPPSASQPESAISTEKMPISANLAPQPSFEVSVDGVNYTVTPGDSGREVVDVNGNPVTDVSILGKVAIDVYVRNKVLPDVDTQIMYVNSQWGTYLKTKFATEGLKAVIPLGASILDPALVIPLAKDKLQDYLTDPDNYLAIVGGSGINAVGVDDNTIIQLASGSNNIDYDTAQKIIPLYFDAQESQDPSVNLLANLYSSATNNVSTDMLSSAADTGIAAVGGDTALPSTLSTINDIRGFIDDAGPVLDVTQFGSQYLNDLAQYGKNYCTTEGELKASPLRYLIDNEFDLFHDQNVNNIPEGNLPPYSATAYSDCASLWFQNLKSPPTSNLQPTQTNTNQTTANQTAPTGYFGPLTQAAVEAYQAKYGIPQTGTVGPLTRAALNGNLSSQNLASNQPSPVNNISAPQPASPQPSVPPTNNTGAPTANIMATNMNITPGGAAIIYWSSTNASTCNVSPMNWSGTNVPQSAGWLQTPQSTQTYTLTCLGPGGTASNSVTVNVTPLQTPSQPAPIPTDWVTLLSQYAASWNAQGYTSGYITDSHGVTQWYQRQGNNWVQVTNQTVAQTPYSPAGQTPITVIASNADYQFSLGVPASANQIYFQATGGTAPYSWSATGMPPGMSVNPSAGTLSGTPTAAGIYSVSIIATDVGGRSGSQLYSFSVGTNPLVIQDSNANTALNETLPSAAVGSSYSQQLEAYGGVQNYSWSTQGILPPGITIGTQSCGGNTCDLPISGTPTQAGTYTFQVVVKDSAGTTASKNITIAVNAAPSAQTSPLTISSVGYMKTVIGQPFSQTFSAAGGSGGYTWSFSGQSPDSGLQLSSGGVLSGATTAPNDCPSGNWTWKVKTSTFFTVTVTDSSGATASTQPLCIISYYPAPQITSISPSSLAINNAQHTVTVTGSNFRSDDQIGITGNDIPTTYISPTSLSFTMYPSTLNGGGFSPTPTTNGPFTAGTYLINILQVYSDLSNKVNWQITAATVPQAVSTNITVTNTQFTLNSPVGNTSFQVAWGSAPYAWTITGLPPGMSNNGGMITGAPTEAGTFPSVKVVVTDTNGITGVQTFTFTVACETTPNGQVCQ